MLDDGNTMLADATLEKLTLLRINRGFMEFMREHYNHLSRQDFKMTVVREKDNSDGDSEDVHLRELRSMLVKKGLPPQQPHPVLGLG